ncbi:MAG: nucleotidyltransferase family protein [Blastomonas sp.]
MTVMHGPVTIALLAAGLSTRFGGDKLDAMLGGKPLGAWALDTAISVQCGTPVLVTGTPSPRFAEAALAAEMVELAINPDPMAGLSSSVAIAARIAQQRRSSTLLLMLADMPFVRIETLRALIEQVEPGRPAAVLHADGRKGIPACFPADYFGALAALTGDRGASALLRSAQNVTIVETATDELSDADTPEELAILAKRLMSR